MSWAPLGGEGGYSFRNGVIRWQISKSIKVVLRIFTPALAVSEILSFQIVDLQKIGQDHGVQLPQLGHSMTDITIYKSVPVDFYASPNHPREINVSMFYLQTVGQGHEAQFSQCDQSGENIKINKSSPIHF